MPYTSRAFRGALIATAGLFAPVALAVCNAPRAFAGQEQPIDPRQITLVELGSARLLSTNAATVAELLREQEITLGKLDRCSVSLSTKLSNGQKIVVTRIRVEMITERTDVAYGVRNVYDPDLRAGTRSVLTEGKNGVKAVTFRDTYKDNERVKREKLSSSSVAPRTAVVKVGLRGMTAQIASRGGTFGPRRVIEMVATGYGPGGNGRWGMQTSTGIRPGFGVVAVDPRVVPLGSRLYVEGYGYAIAGDTGSAIKGLRIDLGFDTDSEAEKVGRRRVKVMLLR